MNFGIKMKVRVNIKVSILCTLLEKKIILCRLENVVHYSVL